MPHQPIPNYCLEASSNKGTHTGLKVDYLIDDRQDAPEVKGNICKFAHSKSTLGSNKECFNVTIKVNRKIWLSHYAIKSPDNEPNHDIKFWQLVCLGENGQEYMLHDH